MSSAGMSLAEREAQRQRYREQALARAEKMGVTLRCQHAARHDDLAEHQICRGEALGGAGCLCPCHDDPGAAPATRPDEPVTIRRRGEPEAAGG